MASVLDRFRGENKKPSALDRFREQSQYGYSQTVVDAKPYEKREPIKEEPIKVKAEKKKDTIKLAGQVIDVADHSDHPSRDIPVVGKILQGLDKAEEFVRPFNRIAGELYTPGGGLANVETMIGNVGAKIAQRAPQLSNTLSGRVATEAIKEGVTGVPLAAGQALAQGHDLDEVAKQGAIGGIAGGVLGGAMPLVGAVARRVIDKYRPVKQSTTSPTLALPEPRQRGNMNQAVTDDVIYSQPRRDITQEVDGVLPSQPKPTDSPSVLDRYKEQPIVVEKGKLKKPFESLEDNYLKQLNEYTDTLYRETTADQALNLIPGSNRYTDTKLDSFYFSNKPELALGQGTNKGIMIEFDSKGIQGQINRSKPGWEMAYKGDSAEFISKNVDQKTYQDSVRSITIQKDVVLENAVKRRLQNTLSEWDKKINPDGSTTYTPTSSKPIQLEVLPTHQKPSEPVDDIIQSKEPRIRDKVVSYLDEQEKAARERLKAKRNTLSSNPIDQYADYAIILAAKAGKGTIKLADSAEFLVKEFGEEIRPHVQSIVNRAKGIAKEAERRATKEAQDARVFNNADSGDASTFRAKVNRDKKASKVPFVQRSEKIRSQLIDDMAALEGVEKRVRGKLSSAEDSLYKSARLFRGVPEKANSIVKDRLAPIINGIESKGYTSADLGDYALAVHAKDVNARDIKSGWTNKEIDGVINRLGTKEMEDARKEIMKISNDMLTELEKQGVISGDLVKALKDRYPNYMPLFRNFDDETVNFSDGLSKALANVTSPIKGLKGSERQVVDPMESMVKNIFQSTNAAERNKVASQLAKLAKDDPDANFIRELAEGEEVGRKNVVSVLVGGNKVRYEVDPEVYKAMLNLDQESTNSLIKVFQKPASLLRAGATLTPEFSLRNPLRDIVQAFVVSESGFNPLIDFPVGLIQSISKGNLYKKWVYELGSYGNIISNDRNVHKEALERVLKESSSKKFVNVVNGKSLIRVLRAISDTTESATKVGEFRAALRKGASPQEAAYRSRDIMDFGRSGSAIRQTNKIVAFLNANIQGKSKLLRAFKANPSGFTARAFTSITVPTVGIFLMQKYMANDAQKQTIDESPAWMTDTFWLVPIPNTDQVARIPKPFDLSTLFSNLPERALKYTYSNDKEAFDGFAKKALADASMPGMITGLLPIIEGMANYSFFRGGRIIPQGEDGRNYEDQHDINTTSTAKLLAKGAEKLTGGQGSMKNFSSPRIMDNTIKGLTAGLGTYATSAIDVMLDKFNMTDNPVKPEKSPAQKPLAKAFLVNPLQGGRSTEKVYELKEKLTRDKGSAKINDKEFKEQAKLKFVTDQTGKMSDITKLIREVENERSLSPKNKRTRIEELIGRRNEIARDTIRRIEAKESATR